MKKILIIIMALTAVLTTAQAQSTAKKKMVYVFGFSASFKDSVVYITDTQQMQASMVGKKVKFLDDRDGYAMQLNNYLTEKGETDRVCMVSFATKEKQIAKKRQHLQKKYTKKGDYDIRTIAAADFAFEPIVNEDPEAEQKLVAKQRKKDKKGKAAEGKPHK